VSFYDNKAMWKYVEEHQVKSCDTCQLACQVCMGPDETYGVPIEETKKLYPAGCGSWDISLSHYNEIMDTYNK